MKHYVYKITHNESGKYYYGKRSCKTSIEDDFLYMGSSKDLAMDIYFQGALSFTKEIVSKHASAKEAYEAEANIITIEMVKSDTCYNRSLGGNTWGSLGRVENLDSTKPMPESFKLAIDNMDSSLLSNSDRDYLIKTRWSDVIKAIRNYTTSIIWSMFKEKERNKGKFNKLVKALNEYDTFSKFLRGERIATKKWLTPEDISELKLIFLKQNS